MRSVLPIVLALAGGVALSASAQEKSPSAQEARQIAESFQAQFEAAYNTNDAAAIAALFTEDGVFVPAKARPPLGAVIKGREGVAAFFKQAFQTFRHDSAKVVEAGALGPSAVWFVAKLHLTGEIEHRPMELDGHATFVVVREAGAWKIKMTSANGGPPHAPGAQGQ